MTDLGDHVADLGDHDRPIRAITIRRCMQRKPTFNFPNHPVRTPGANVFAMRLFSALLFATCALTNLPACSGAECHGTQENFGVTPSESCLEPVLDACDAEIGALTLQNNCSDALVIPESGGSAGAPDTGVVDSTQVEVTIDPGENAYFSCTAFADASNGKLWHVTIPALLGSSSITISFDIAR
jgi:hypothetical protein